MGKEAESLAAVEIRVESSCMAAVCGLHHAVLRRAQVQRGIIGGMGRVHRFQTIEHEFTLCLQPNTVDCFLTHRLCSLPPGLRTNCVCQTNDMSSSALFPVTDSSAEDA